MYRGILGFGISGVGAIGYFICCVNILFFWWYGCLEGLREEIGEDVCEIMDFYLLELRDVLGIIYLFEEIFFLKDRLVRGGFRIWVSIVLGESYYFWNRF